MALIGASLLAQYLTPGRGATMKHGHEQLFYRGILRGAGVPLYFALAAEKVLF